nr:MAG TPA: Cytosine specific methyltransferase [Caudoviricetes sp.]
MKNELTLGSLFDGSGGFPLGGMLAGITPLWASEIEPFAVRVTTKRLPRMKHYGDVSSLNGADLPPVDIITFGSPCQDMSIAGKRSGLDGSRSSLFYEAVRIIKEMRCATNGKYPRFCVWENVPGAFSSNKGEDFRCVLESLCRVRDETVSVPRCEKWTNAGEILADGFSIAWRVLDAQYWGVPQRRKRIYLVADFDGECAGKVLFESESVSGYSAEGFKAWQRAAAAAESGSGTTGAVCLNDQGGQSIEISNDITATLRAETHGHPPCVMDSAVYENHSQDTRYTGPLEVAPTVSSTYGMGGNNQPFVVEDTRCFDVRFTSDGTKNARQNCYETDTSRTIDTGGNSPDSNQGGVAVVAVQGSMIGRAEKNGPQGSGVNEDVSFTLNATDRHAVAFSQDSYTKYSENDKCGALRAAGGMYGGGSETLVYSTSKNSYHTEAEENLANTLVASDYKDPPTVNSPEYIVRRLTPTECARLQGFPDWWCADLGTDEPTDEELTFWKDVFETHRKIVGGAVKPKSEKQILTWLKNPHSDSAEYKLWGNGVAMPCVFFVLSGIAWVSSCSN